LPIFNGLKVGTGGAGEGGIEIGGRGRGRRETLRGGVALWIGKLALTDSAGVASSDNTKNAKLMSDFGLSMVLHQQPRYSKISREIKNR